MNRASAIVLSLALIGGAGAATIYAYSIGAASDAVARHAAEQTVTLKIENMTCAACPITVRTAIARVKGVKSVEVDFDAKTATVVFDPEIATIEKIAAASTNAGYPAYVA